MRVIGMAEKYVKKNKIEKGQIWCVYEKDSFPAKDFNGVVQRAERLNHEIRMCSTMLHGAMSVLSSGFFCILRITQQIITGQSILRS